MVIADARGRAKPVVHTDRLPAPGVAVFEAGPLMAATTNWGCR